jgi:hypothetical protein
MSGWEYRTTRVRYDHKQHKDWVLTYTDGPSLVGLPAILEAFGSRSWELVSLQPDGFEAYPEFGKWSLEPVAYRIIFKRRLPEG